MNIDEVLGKIGLYFAFIASFIAIVFIILQIKKTKNSNDANLTKQFETFELVLVGSIFLGTTLAVFAMERAFFLNDFSIAYVYNNHARNTPLLYTFTGLWSALQGSILLWVFLLGAYCFLLSIIKKKDRSLTILWAKLIVIGITIFFLGLVIGPANPFQLVAGKTPLNGLGPNPLLQNNSLVAIHPIFLYSGFVGFTIPFALTLGRLIANEHSLSYQFLTRRFLLLPWAFLSIGIVMGAWWSYQVLGWGGFWAWDPVENAALLPWITSTAALHSAIATENRSVLKVWTMTLVLSTFVLTILGTFLTRSGIIESVHAFAYSGAVGPLLAIFLGIVTVLSLTLIAFKASSIPVTERISPSLNKSAAFVLNNVFFLLFALVVLVGTIDPIIASALGQSESVGAPFYNTLGAPLGLVILVLMGIAPLLSFKPISFDSLLQKLFPYAVISLISIAVLVLMHVRDTVTLIAYFFGILSFTVAGKSIIDNMLKLKKQHRNPLLGLISRSGGGMIAHLGLIILALGIVTALSYGQRGEVNLSPGQYSTFDGVKITYLKSTTFNVQNATITQAEVLVNGKGPYNPKITVFDNANEGIGSPAIKSNLFQDIYLTVAELPQGSTQQSIVIGVIIQPLVEFIWIGGFIMFFGGLAAILPKKRSKTTVTQKTEATELEKAIH